MLSLDNVFDPAELRAWADRLAKTLGRSVGGYTVEPKIDGMAIAARYIDGHLMQVATRGDGCARCLRRRSRSCSPRTPLGTRTPSTRC